MGTYVCECCGGTFNKVVSDDEVLKEMHELWGDVAPHERASVCDDCFKDFMAWWKRREHRD